MTSFCEDLYHLAFRRGRGRLGRGRLGRGRGLKLITFCDVAQASRGRLRREAWQARWCETHVHRLPKTSQKLIMVSDDNFLHLPTPRLQTGANHLLDLRIGSLLYTLPAT